MKAICIKEPGKVEIVEQEKPVRKPGEALLKLLYGGICGSDLGSYRGANAYRSTRPLSGRRAICPASWNTSRKKASCRFA